MDEKTPLTDIAYDIMICRKALSGEVGVFDAAKSIFANHPNSEDPWNIDIPETDALGYLVDEVEREIPQGFARQHWNSKALAQRDKLKPQIEEKHKEEAMQAGQAIINLW